MDNSNKNYFSASYDLLEQVILNMPDPVAAVDENLNILECNKAFYQLFGFDNKAEFFPKFHEVILEILPEQAPTVAEAAEELAKLIGDGNVNYEFVYTDQSGIEIPILVEIVAAVNEGKPIYIGYCRDISVLNKAISSIEVANENIKAMLEMWPVCCVFWDKKHRVIYCNRETVNFFGLPNKDVYLEKFLDLSPDVQPDGRASKEKAIAMLEEAFKSGKVTFEWMHQRLDGEPISSEITLVRAAYDGNTIVVGYIRDLRQLKETVLRLNQLEHMAFTDTLTGMYNRRYFMEKAKHYFNLPKQDVGYISIAMMDIDFFKSVNDEFGHMAGDDVLKHVMRVAEDSFRPTDIIARFGGDEFIIMRIDENPHSLEKCAEKFRKQVEKSVFDYHGKKVRITVTLGVTVRKSREGIQDVIKRADDNLYAAKNSGRNRIMC